MIPLKICVLNLSGNVGKSELSVHMLGGFRPGARILSVETVNYSNMKCIDGLDVAELDASQFRDIYRQMLLHDDLIIDVGSSNVVTFLSELARYKAAIGEFDLIVVPTVPAEKQQRDTIATLDLLSRLGFDGGKVRVVFNQRVGNNTLDNVYNHVIGYSMHPDGQGNACWLPVSVVDHNDVFDLIKPTRKTISEAAGDKTDWKALRIAAKAGGDMAALDAAIDGHILHDLGKTAYANLQQAYADLLAPYVTPTQAMPIKGNRPAVEGLA